MSPSSSVFESIALKVVVWCSVALLHATFSAARGILFSLFGYPLPYPIAYLTVTIPQFFFGDFRNLPYHIKWYFQALPAANNIIAPSAADLSLEPTSLFCCTQFFTLVRPLSLPVLGSVGAYLWPPCVSRWRVLSPEHRSQLRSSAAPAAASTPSRTGCRCVHGGASNRSITVLCLVNTVVCVSDRASAMQHCTWCVFGCLWDCPQ